MPRIAPGHVYDVQALEVEVGQEKGVTKGDVNSCSKKGLLYLVTSIPYKMTSLPAKWL